MNQFQNCKIFIYLKSSVSISISFDPNIVIAMYKAIESVVL